MNGSRQSGKGRLILLGIISGAHGIHGDVKLRSYTAVPEDIITYGTLRDKAGKSYAIRIKGSTKDALIAAIEGIHSRSDAESLRNTELFVPRSALPAPNENEYYHEDLIGMRLLTAENLTYGVIAAMHNFGAGDLVAIRRESGEEEMLPFRTAIFTDIDFDKGSATIVPPEMERGE